MSSIAGYDTTLASVEWYTPEKYINAAKKVMGKIDLDPASCELANTVVKAVKYYDIYSNGLDKKWSGKVWLNPPYGKFDGISNQNRWSGKLISEYEIGNIEEAILLVSGGDISPIWFHRLLYYHTCFHLKRIQFKSASNNKAGSMGGSLFVYFGTNVDKFIDIFSQFGTCMPPAYKRHTLATLFD